MPSKMTHISLTVAKQVFYARYQAISISGAMRGLTLQQNQLFARYKINMKLPACELIPRVSKFCLDEWQPWQDKWDGSVGNKLHSIYPTVAILEHSKNMSRYDFVVNNRFRIGHCHLTHTRTYCLLMICQPANLADFH